MAKYISYHGMFPKQVMVIYLELDYLTIMVQQNFLKTKRAEAKI